MKIRSVITELVRRATILVTLAHAIAVAAALVVPSVILAQIPIEDLTPPTITISPSSSGARESLIIQFADSVSIDQATMVMTVNGVNVTSAFDYTFHQTCSPQHPCGVTAISHGQFHLSAGNNDFHVEICDREENCGSKDANYVYTPPPPLQLVHVSPNYESLSAEPGYSYVRMFHIQNGSTVSNTYTLTRSCSAAILGSGCLPATSTRTIAAGQTDTASITFTEGSTRGASGQVKLVVALTTDATARDSGVVDVHTDVVAAAGIVVMNLNPGESVDRGLCLTVSLHSGAYECGDLRLDYDFPGVRTMEKDRAPTLIYSNEAAHPIERIAAEITLPNDSRVPDSITAKLLVTRAGSQIQVDAEKWLGSDWRAAGTRRVMLSYDAITDSTGLYQYTIQTSRYYGATIETNSVASDLVVVNRSNSPFGAGWWLAGLERLIPLTGSKWLWIGGDGSTRVFSPSGTNLWLAGNVDRRERLEWNGTNYCRRLPHHACVLFNTQGQHVQTRNRLGEVLATLDRTNFTYSANLLTSIQLPVPSGSLSYLFAYDTVSGKPRLLRVTAPPMGTTTRVTSATITAGQLLSLKYNAHPAVQFGYDGTLSNRILSVTDQRGVAETYAFGLLNTLATAKLALLTSDTITYAFVPVETKGVAGSARHAVTHQASYTLYDGPLAGSLDTTSVWPDRFGAPAKIQDALGNETILTRADPNYPALVTQLRLANGRTTTATYDSVGHVLTSTIVNPLGDGHNATTTNTWNMKFDFVATTTSPTGLLYSFGYDTLTGNRIWEYPGTDVARKVLYQYGNTLLQLSSSQLPGYAVRDSVTYGSLGNVVTSISPKGFVRSTYENSIGADTLNVSPIGRQPTDTARTRQLSKYDDRGLVISDSTNGSGIEWRVVRSHYDESGNNDTVAISMSPDVNHIGTTTHAFTFDNVDRRTIEKVGDQTHTHTHTWTFDHAGNQINGGARGGNAVANTYNVLNQLIKRSADGISTFSYDAVGSMTSANNENARITRSYYPGGQLQSDTMRVATVFLSDSDYSRHVYGIRYGYDLEGRRLWRKRPTLGNANDSTAYAYDPAIGALALIVDGPGDRYTFSYDLASRLVKQVFRSGQPDSAVKLTTYDAESNRTGYAGHLATYDGRGKMYDGDSLVYAPLGALKFRGSGGLTEIYTPDALGNVSFKHMYGEFTERETMTTSVYQPGSGLLVSDLTPDGPAVDTNSYSYGVDNVLLATLKRRYAGYFDATRNLNEERYTTNQYDAQDQLIASQFSLDTFPRPTTPQYADYHSNESYRYDALNRRVWIWNVRGANCSTHDRASGCRSNVRRTVWDGDQILAEIQVPGDTSSMFLEQDGYSSGPYYGVVFYTHGLGIDAPLALYKGSTMIVPDQDLSGRFVDGSCHPTACGSLEIFWPEATGSAYSILGTSPTGPPSWFGSIIEGQQDASGYQYKRNRYYDPQTGRFTKEDPIGLAGGLNAYGFANGDPINYSDPFGLCPCNFDDFAQQTGRLLQPWQAPLEVAGAVATLPLMSAGAVEGISAEVLDLGNTLNRERAAGF